MIGDFREELGVDDGAPGDGCADLLVHPEGGDGGDLSGCRGCGEVVGGRLAESGWWLEVFLLGERSGGDILEMVVEMVVEVVAVVEVMSLCVGVRGEHLCCRVDGGCRLCIVYGFCEDV